MTIALIIDDNRMNIDVLKMLLEAEGVQAVVMESPRNIATALETVEAVDVVFLDVEMPNYNGFVVLQDLKKYEMLNEASFVAYTVHTSEIDVARRAGFNSFLGKPLNVRRFPEQLKRILNREEVWEI